MYKLSYFASTFNCLFNLCIRTINEAKFLKKCFFQTPRCATRYSSWIFYYYFFVCRICYFSFFKYYLFIIFFLLMSTSDFEVFLFRPFILTRETRRAIEPPCRYYQPPSDFCRWKKIKSKQSKHTRTCIQSQTFIHMKNGKCEKERKSSSFCCCQRNIIIIIV